MIEIATFRLNVTIDGTMATTALRGRAAHELFDPGIDPIRALCARGRHGYLMRDDRATGRSVCWCGLHLFPDGEWRTPAPRGALSIVDAEGGGLSPADGGELSPS